MCKKRSTRRVNINPSGEKPNFVRLDACLINIVKFINTHPSIKTLASCCGHGRYDMSIVIKHKTGLDGKYRWLIKDLISGADITRKKRFYIKDKKGFYYIPEAV